MATIVFLAAFGSFCFVLIQVLQFYLSMHLRVYIYRKPVYAE